MSRLEKLRSANPAGRLSGIAELLGEEAAPPSAAELEALARCLGDTEKGVQRRAAEAFATFAEPGTEARARLLAALASADSRQRWCAAFALSLRGSLPERARPVLLEATGDADSDVRWAAADILARQAPRAVLVPEMCALLQEGTAIQRKMAAYCLRELGVKSAAVENALVAGLRDREMNVRLAVVAALARLAIDRHAAAERLCALLGDVDAGVRRAAAVGLGMFSECPESAISALRRASVGDDPSLRRAAAHALRRLNR